jgi:hypothetical protein
VREFFDFPPRNICDNDQNRTLDGFSGCTLEIYFILFFCYTNTNAVFDRPQRTCVTFSRIQTLKDDSLEIMCEGLLSYYSVSSSFPFFFLLFYFSTLTPTQRSNALKRALVQIFLLFLFISIKKSLLGSEKKRQSTCFFVVNERMWGHALTMIMSIKNILCTDF